MLTLAKIQAYERFDGDIDGYARARGAGDTSGITDDDWWLIDRLCQAIYLVVTQQAAESFREQTEQELQTVTTDELTREALWRLAKSQL
jgi:hypothetical protein